MNVFSVYENSSKSQFANYVRTNDIPNDAKLAILSDVRDTFGSNSHEFSAYYNILYGDGTYSPSEGNGIPGISEPGNYQAAW